MAGRVARMGVSGDMKRVTGGTWLGAVCVALVMLSGTVHAEVAAADPIDAAMRTCLARSDMSSTAGQVQCMDTARAAWQAALDTAWQQLQAKSPAAQRSDWAMSQRRWKAWREAEAPLLKAVFETTSGTMYVLSEADMQLQPVRDRALALRAAAANAGKGDRPPARLPSCSRDAQCEHANYDLNRYYRKLHTKMPARTRSTLVRAQRAWMAYGDATTRLVDARGRIDIIGARVATMKRLSETVGND